MIFPKYIIKEFLTKVLLTFSVLYLVFLLAQSQVVAADIHSLGLVSYDFLYLIFCSSFSEIIPIWTASVFFGALLTVVHLNKSGELTVALVGGRSLLKISRPFFFVACFFVVIHLVFANYLRPLMKKKRQEYIYKKAFAFIDSSLENKVRNNSFTHIFQGYSLYVGKAFREQKKYEKVILAEQKKRVGGTLIVADEAEIVGSIENKDMVLLFKKGKAYQLGAPEESLTFSFKTFEIPLFDAVISHLPKKFLSTEYEEMNTWKLYTDFLSHAPAKKTQSYRGLTYIFYERIFSCLIIFSFTCLALFFGVFNTRLSTGFAYAACFFLFLGTDILFKSASIWVKSGAIKAAILVPGLYLAALILSFLLFYQKSRRPLWDSF